MINRLKQFFSQHLALDDDGPSAHPEHVLRLATAALLIEVSRADYSLEETEQQAIVTLLERQFGLSTEQLELLISQAQQEVDRSVSLYPFTRLINDHYSAAQKQALIRQLWEIALADGDLDKYEDHLIRQVAELIYVPHSEFIRAKLQVIEGRDG